MADRIEREIEEILAKLEDLPGEKKPDRSPIPIEAVRKQRQKAERAARPSAGASLSRRVNSTSVLLAGAAMVVFGLVLSNVWSQLIWAALAGVVVFFGGFLSGFLRKPRAKPSASAPAAPKAVFWRDRYISYEPTGTSPWEKVKHRFGRK